MEKVVADNKARQGPKGKPVLYVLIGSFCLIGLYLIGTLMWSGAQTPTSPTQGASQNANAPASSSQNSSAVPAGNPAYPSPSSTTTNAPASTPPAAR